MAFDPDWPAQPFIYVLHTGYTYIDQSKGQKYPNNINSPRPLDWNNIQCGNYNYGKQQ